MPSLNQLVQNAYKAQAAATEALAAVNAAITGTGTGTGGTGRQRGRPPGPTRARATTTTTTTGTTTTPTAKPTLAQLPGIIAERYPQTGANPTEVRTIMGWNDRSPMVNVEKRLVQTGQLTKVGDRYVATGAAQKVA